MASESLITSVQFRYFTYLHCIVLMKLSYLDLTTTDATLNLATEQYIFDHFPRNQSYFMLWQNRKAIVIGKHQNTTAEINEDYVRNNNVQVVRRLSGGGAVYHDLGNLNFTFISDVENLESLNFRLFCTPLINVLKEMGIHAKLSGRNDLTIDGLKFSGNSQYVRNGRVLHHGTILFSSDLDAVEQALCVDRTKIQAKGIQSVRSRVTNICDHLPSGETLSQFRQQLLSHVIAQNSATPCTFTEADLLAIRELQMQRYSSWDWNYGKSPECTLLKRRRVDGCGLIEILISLNHGLIDSIVFQGDFFSLDSLRDLCRKFIGIRPTKDDYTQALLDVNIPRYFVGLSKETLLDILTK